MSSSHTSPVPNLFTFKTQAEAQLTETSQCQAQPSDSTDSTIKNEAIDDLASLNFPTLSPDGSTADITVIRTQHYPRTPPAALSSLGAKQRMARNSMDDSVESLADEQYDMVDDASELSSDDRETVSVVSTDQHESDEDGMITPEDTGSIVDIEEESEPSDSVANLQDSLENLERLTREQARPTEEQIKAENILLDSYMTEDLETPRQSTVHQGVARSASPQGTAADSGAVDSFPTTSAEKTTPLRILFVSEKSVSDGEMAQVCHKIATCLAGPADTHLSDAPHIVRLPPTPSGINPTSALLLRTGNVEIIVEHCVDANIRNTSSQSHRAPKSYNLLVQDADKEHSSIFTVGKDSKIDLKTPGLVVFYLTRPKSYPSWLLAVKEAMLKMHVPSMTIGAPGFQFAELDDQQKYHVYDSEIVTSSHDFFDWNDDDLRDDLDILLNQKAHPKPRVPSLRNTKNNHNTMRSLIAKSFIMRYLLPLLMIVTIFGLPHVKYSSPNPVAELAIRRDALSTALVQITNSTDATKSFDVDHLLPRATPSLSHGFEADSRYEAAANRFVISVPREAGSCRSRRFPRVLSTKLSSVDRENINFNLTKLIDGVYDVNIATSDAYGTVNVRMITKDPSMNVSASHNFGWRMLQRKTYQKASTELSTFVNKDIAVARKRARSLTEILGFELTVGATATKNVTTHVAVYVARDLQVIANTAVSVFVKAAAASNDTAARLGGWVGREVNNTKSIVRSNSELMKRDAQRAVATVARFTKDLIPTKDTIQTSLIVSRERALIFQDILAGRKKDTNSTSPTKELSLRFQNIFNPTEKSKRAGSLSDIARCMRSEDYLACRKEQRRNQKALSAYNPPSAVAKISDQDVLAQAANERFPRCRHNSKVTSASASCASNKAAAKRKAEDKKRARRGCQKQR